MNTVPLFAVPPDRLGDELDRIFPRIDERTMPYAVTQNYTFDTLDKIDSLQVDATNGPVTITLPSSTGNRRRRVVKTDSSANAVTVVGTINGAVNFSLPTQYDFVEVEPTGAAWLVIAYGKIVPSFNGIKFPTVQVPSSDANTLDDYEEGTWTPSLGGNTTYTIQIGTYTKIGRLVTGQVRLKVNVLGTGSTSTISGLPFAVGTNDIYAGSVGFWNALSTTYVFVGCYITGSTIVFTGATAATAGLTTATLFGDGADVMVTFNYSV